MPREYVAVFLQDPDVQEPDEILGEPDPGITPADELPTDEELARDPDIEDVVIATRQVLSRRRSQSP